MVESNVENQKYGYKDSVPKFRNIMGCNKIKHFYLNFDWLIWSLNTFFLFFFFLIFNRKTYNLSQMINKSCLKDMFMIH